MSIIDKQALRDELSNPAIGSNAHLRKLALALLDELEADGQQIKTLESRNRRLDGIIAAAEKRIAELQELRKADSADREMLKRLYDECDTGERRGNGSQSGVAMPSWVTVEAARLLLGVK